MNNLRRRLPSANALFTFEAAARCGNFTHAAQELYVTQPAVSRTLARMENHLGVKLFERKAGQVTLTEEGRLLYLRVSEAFQGIDGALREIERRNTGKETITLSVSTAFAAHWLMPRMEQLRAIFPDVDLRYQLIQGPLAGPVEDVDLGMRYFDGPQPDANTVVLTPELLVPVCSVAYRRTLQNGSSHADAPGPTLINLSQSQVDWFEHYAKHCGGNLREAANVLSFPDYAVVLQAALLGQGVTMGWINVAGHWLRTRMLVPAQKHAFATGRVCHLIFPHQRPSRGTVTDIASWIIEQTEADMRAIDQIYPTLGITGLLRA